MQEPETSAGSIQESALPQNQADQNETAELNTFSKLYFSAAHTPIPGEDRQAKPRGTFGETPLFPADRIESPDILPHTQPSQALPLPSGQKLPEPHLSASYGSEDSMHQEKSSPSGEPSSKRFDLSTDVQKFAMLGPCESNFSSSL